MPYSDFTLKKAKEDLGIAVVEQRGLFAHVESKDDKTTGGLGQCIAEFYAAQIFNQTEGQIISALYGAITTGSHWRFLIFRDNTATIDMDEYPIETPGKIVAILIAMANQTA